MNTSTIHCGACGNMCGPNEVCDEGACVCAEGYKECQGECIAEEACCDDGDCPDTATCVEGECVCPPGQALCEDTCMDATRLMHSAAHCGACNHRCEPQQVCRDGICVEVPVGVRQGPPQDVPKGPNN